MSALERFFGGAPGAVLIRLAVISVVVGIILTAIGIHPYELIDSVRRLAIRIYNMGFDVFRWLFDYLWLGGLVVLPVWLISRIWTLYLSDGRRDGYDDLADAPGGKPGAR